MPTVPNSEAEILNSLKVPWNVQGNRWFATDLQGRKRTSGVDPRTGMFHQMRPTTGDTACSVNGVLPVKSFVCVQGLSEVWTILLFCHRM